MPKKTVEKKKHSLKPVQKKQKHTMSQSQSQTVHVHLHKKTYSQKTQSHVHKKTTSTPVSAIPFVSPLPMYLIAVFQLLFLLIALPIMQYL